jgi:hypothetical protein
VGTGGLISHPMEVWQWAWHQSSKAPKFLGCMVYLSTKIAASKDADP